MDQVFMLYVGSIVKVHTCVCDTEVFGQLEV